jgi:hypothetical protein
LKERGVKQIDIMNKAKRIKNDEFYTRYEDIEKEIEMYDKSIWKDKVVFCNCDDAVDTDARRTSAFTLYNFDTKKWSKFEFPQEIVPYYSSKTVTDWIGSKYFYITPSDATDTIFKNVLQKNTPKVSGVGERGFSTSQLSPIRQQI